MLFATVSLAAAFALWATQPWGWLFAHYLAIFGLLEAFIVMIANNSFTDGLAVALFPLASDGRIEPARRQNGGDHRGRRESLRRLAP